MGATARTTAYTRSCWGTLTTNCISSQVRDPLLLTSLLSLTCNNGPGHPSLKDLIPALSLSDSPASCSRPVPLPFPPCSCFTPSLPPVLPPRFVAWPPVGLHPGPGGPHGVRQGQVPRRADAQALCRRLQGEKLEPCVGWPVVISRDLSGSWLKTNCGSIPTGHALRTKHTHVRARQIHRLPLDAF